MIVSLFKSFLIWHIRNVTMTTCYYQQMTVTLKQLQIVFEKELLDEARTIPLILFTGKPVHNVADSAADNAPPKDPSVYDHPVYIEISNWSANVSYLLPSQFAIDKINILAYNTKCGSKNISKCRDYKVTDVIQYFSQNDYTISSICSHMSKVV